MHLHPTLTRLLEIEQDLLTCKEVADALQVSVSAVERALQNGKMEGTLMSFRGQGAAMRYRVTKAAAIRWLWKNTNSDRTILRAAIEQAVPSLLPYLDGSLHADAEREEEAIRKASKRTRRHGPLELLVFDPHNDLFPHVKPAAFDSAKVA